MSFFFNLQEIDYHHHHHQDRTDHDEHDHMDSGGSIRSYDCVFCQRGFTTAQALGGHMNIHRKDRANPTTTNKPSPTKEPTNNIINNNNNAIFSNKEILLEDDYHVDNVANTKLFYSSSHLNNGNSSSFEGRVHRFLGDHSPTLRGGSGHMLGKRIQDHDHSQGAEELDLELRLGHYSW